MIAGEILEITLGTPMTPDGLGILCRAINPTGQMRLFYLLYKEGQSLGLLIIGVAAAAVEERLNNVF